ncbi:MAG TPA: acetyltransferase [Lacunisphaera sp.]|jgi:UDP-perosamine 4-acetyltransferase
MGEPYHIKPPVIVIGGGGHAKVLISTLILLGRKVLGFVDPKTSLPPILGISTLGDDQAISLHDPDKVHLVNGVGTTGISVLRRQIYQKFRKTYYNFETVIHPSAIIALDVEIADGVQIMAGAIVQPGSRLGANAIINTGVRVDHDCSIEAHAHLAPGVTLSGGVLIAEGSFVGTGASIIHGISVGPNSIVGAGAVVIRNVPAGVTVAGVPARVMAAKNKTK